MGEHLRTADRIGVILVGLLGILPVLATLIVAWWVLLGGEP